MPYQQPTSSNVVSGINPTAAGLTLLGNTGVSSPAAGRLMLTGATTNAAVTHDNTTSLGGWLVARFLTNEVGHADYSITRGGTAQEFGGGGQLANQALTIGYNLTSTNTKQVSTQIKYGMIWESPYTTQLGAHLSEHYHFFTSANNLVSYRPFSIVNNLDTNTADIRVQAKDFLVGQEDTTHDWAYFQSLSGSGTLLLRLNSSLSFQGNTNTHFVLAPNGGSLLGYAASVGYLAAGFASINLGGLIDASSADITLKLGIPSGASDNGGRIRWLGSAGANGVFQFQLKDTTWVNLGTPMLGTPTELTIVSGLVTPTLPFHTIDTEADGATDDLFVIGSLAVGRMLLIRASHNDRTVVLKGSGGNLILPGATDISLDHTNDMVLLVSDGSNWIHLLTSNNG